MNKHLSTLMFSTNIRASPFFSFKISKLSFFHTGNESESQDNFALMLFSYVYTKRSRFFQQHEYALKMFVYNHEIKTKQKKFIILNNKYIKLLILRLQDA